MDKKCNSPFYSRTPISVKFSEIDYLNTIYKYWKNEQNLRSKGVMPWMIWHGIIQKTMEFHIGFKAPKVPQK